MPADWSDEADDHADRRDDNPAASHPARPAHPESEPPSRQEAYVSLRIAVSAEQATAARQTTAAERAATEKWTKSTEEHRYLWSEYQRHWPDQAHPQPDRSNDPPNSWRGETGRYLEPSDNGQVEAVCDQIAQREREKLTPMMRDIESQDLGRSLVGLEDRLKGRGRIKEKVFDKMHELGFSSEEASSRISDSIRFTFQYPDSRYTQGVWADIGRLVDHGMELLQLKNSWPNDQYKGINSQWKDSSTGQRFEVQFHTRISFEAKELTHKSYERLRAERPDIFEQMVLEAFQKKVSSEVPIPPGATDIPDYP